MLYDGYDVVVLVILFNMMFIYCLSIGRCMKYESYLENYARFSSPETDR